MIETHGLTHISLTVSDLERTLQFYRAAFGVREYHRADDVVQVLGPGPHDVLVFTRSDAQAGEQAGISHFGFRLVDPSHIDAAVAEVERAGGRILERGEHAPGLPYAYVADPDGYVIELWYE